MKKLTRLIAAKIVANVMTNRGFMNGWFGDTSDEFKLEQAQAIANMRRGSVNTPYTAEWWYELNAYNMTKYCRIPRRVQLVALGLV